MIAIGFLIICKTYYCVMLKISSQNMKFWQIYKHFFRGKGFDLVIPWCKKLYHDARANRDNRVNQYTNAGFVVIPEFN